MAALSAALAPTLRRLAVGPWPFGTEGCAEEWPQLCSLEDWGALAHDLGPVHLPRLEQMAVFREGYAPAFPEGFDALGFHPRPASAGAGTVRLRRRGL
jgi:hypothetical protein